MHRRGFKDGITYVESVDEELRAAEVLNKHPNVPARRNQTSESHEGEAEPGEDSQVLDLASSVGNERSQEKDGNELSLSDFNGRARRHNHFEL